MSAFAPSCVFWLPGVTPVGASLVARVSRVFWVLALVSKNAGCIWTWPVTFAPAWCRAVLMPVTVGPSAPGAVTSTTFCPPSRLASSCGAAA